jgi:hypothetical protein
MVLKEQRTDHVKADPRIVMDLFLDVDHIPTVHAGVYDIIGITDVRDVRWTYHDWGSLQLVHNNERVNAAWLAVYPGTMIEWQRGALFITVVHPTTSTTECEVEVFKYMDTEQSDLWEMNQQIWETAWSQDRAQAEKIVEFQTDTSKLEESKKHFRKFL